MNPVTIAKNVGASGVGGAGGISSNPLETTRNRESNSAAAGAEFKKSLADSIAQATAAQPQALDKAAALAQPARGDVVSKVATALANVGGTEGLKFSAHAVDRMKSRGISFAPDVMKGIESAVSRAAAKGSKDTLVLTGDNALIVSVKNNTVVTVMDKNAMRENVFTNIDSTVIA